MIEAKIVMRGFPQSRSTDAIEVGIQWGDSEDGFYRLTTYQRLRGFDAILNEYVVEPDEVFAERARRQFLEGLGVALEPSLRSRETEAHARAERNYRDF